MLIQTIELTGLNLHKINIIQPKELNSFNSTIHLSHEEQKQLE